MASAHTDRSEGKTTGAARAKASGMDAIALLERDHREVQDLFRRFQGSSEDQEDEKAELAQQICTALKVHTQIEEELFYPEARDDIDQPLLVEEAIVEHQGAKELIAQIEGMEPGEELFEARMKVLCEQINHHIEEEESELFPACRKAGMDLEGLGRKLMDRKQALMSAPMSAGRASRGH